MRALCAVDDMSGYKRRLSQGYAAARDGDVELHVPGLGDYAVASLDVGKFSGHDGMTYGFSSTNG